MRTTLAKTGDYIGLPTACTSAPSPPPSALNCSSRAETDTAPKSSPKPSAICDMLVFIYDANVVPVRFAEGKVDVKVITRDVWTLDPEHLFRPLRRHQFNQRQSPGREFSGLGQAGGGRAQQRRRSHQQARGVFGSQCARVALDGRARLCRFERRQSARRAALAALLFARYALERDAGGAELRSYDFALFSRQYRGPIQ